MCLNKHETLELDANVDVMNGEQNKNEETLNSEKGRAKEKNEIKFENKRITLPIE